MILFLVAHGEYEVFLPKCAVLSFNMNTLPPNDIRNLFLLIFKEMISFKQVLLKSCHVFLGGLNEV